MLETEYSRALYVRPGRIAGYRLRPFSLWHAFTLDYLDSPFTVGTRIPTAGDCAIAIAVLRSSYADGLRRVLHMTSVGWRERLAVWRVQAHGASRTAKGIAAHIEAYSGYPEIWQPTRKAGQPTTKQTGAPWQWYVAAIAASDYGMTLEAAWNTPVVMAAILKAIQSERNGGAELVSIEEQERQARKLQEAVNG